MKIFLNGKIGRTYVQSLCMMFFHGVKFPLNDENTDNIELYVDAEEKENGVFSKATFKIAEKEESADAFIYFNNKDSLEKTYKKVVLQAVFLAGSKITGKSLEWGILTGIRPSKVALDLLRELGENKAKEILIKEYFLSEKKADLVVDVAKYEGIVGDSTGFNECSIYISIPFCPSRCTYCSFISYAGKKLFSLIPDYIKKLLSDIKETASIIKENNLRLVSVYIGGGTPTILNEEMLEALLLEITQSFDLSCLREFTLESGRPDTITEEKLEIAKKYGVTRISVNPQTLNDEVLELIGRRHTVSDFFKAYDNVSNSNIKHINTDLIAGLDGDTLESFSKTVDEIIKLSPSNVTVHSFCVKKSAQILEDDREIYEKENSSARDSVDYAYKRLTESGYVPYYMYRQKNTVENLENVGYAKPDAIGLYNIFMMCDSHSVFGIGAGATTKLVKDGVIERIFSPKYPYEYLRENQNIKDRVKDFFEKE